MGGSFETMSHVATESPRRHRLTVEDYYRMGEAGILRPDERAELIDGEIIDMPPPGSLHAGTVNQLLELLYRATGGSAMIRVQNPVRLDRYSEPQPDLTLLRPRADFYKSAHPQPSDVLLMIEVADTSLRFDRDVKAALYARHAVPEFWLIDVRNAQLTRYRQSEDSAYGRVDHPDLGAPLEIAALADVRIDLGTLFAA
jgi:Uma2 family endonuclease